VRLAVSKPTEIKADRRFVELDNIDIHLEESVGDSGQYDEVEEMYRDMDLFP
jgi:hypothetical protein